MHRFQTSLVDAQNRPYYVIHEKILNFTNDLFQHKICFYTLLISGNIIQRFIKYFKIVTEKPKRVCNRHHFNFVLHGFACHPFAGAMLIFSVSIRF